MVQHEDVAVGVLEDRHVADTAVDGVAAELDALCLDRIARFKRPRDYRFVEMLPKNNYGKVLKTELRRLLAEQP